MDNFLNHRGCGLKRIYQITAKIFLGTKLESFGVAYIVRPTLLLLMLSPFFLLPHAVEAQSQSGVSMTAWAGFDGFCKEGNWIPVRVILENQGESIQGRLEAHLLPSTANQSLFAQEISLPNTSRKETYLYIFPESYASDLKIDLLSSGTTIASRTLKLTCLSHDDMLAGVLADAPSAFNVLNEIEPPNGRTSVAQLSPDDLPDQATALQALDVLVISGIDSGLLTTAQKGALASWLANGGQLIIIGGVNWQKTAAGLDELLPLKPESTQSLSNLDSLATYSDTSMPLNGEVLITRGELLPDSQVVVNQEDIPLVIRRSYGFGQVTFLAADPTLDPIRNWSGTPALYRKLISTGVSRPGWAGGFQNWSAAANAVTSLPNLNLPPTAVIVGFLLLYVLAIGPVNYLLLRIFKRRELAWISIPALVIIFSAAAIIVGGLARGTRPVLNQLAIVQVWPETGQARVDGLLGVFSPQRATYNLQVNPGFLVQDLSGGNRLSNPGELKFLRSENGDTTIPGLRVDVSDIRAVALQGMIPAPVLTHNLVMNMDRQSTSIEGQIINNSDLTLNDAVLMAPGASMPIGELKPHTQVNVQLALNPTGQAAASSFGTKPSIAPVYAYPISSFNDSTFIDLLGTSDFSANPETFRRYNLLSAAMNYGPYNSGRGSGVYLAGWSESAPFDASLSGENFNQSNTTLYLITLTPEVKAQGDTITLPPGFFVWEQLLENSGAYTSPYEFELSPGTYAFRYSLAQSINFSAIKALTLHLKSYGNTGPVSLEVSLWDFSSDLWSTQPNLQWGDNTISQPDRYIGPEGEIRLRLNNNGPAFSPVMIEAADFTLEVAR